MKVPHEAPEVVADRERTFKVVVLVVVLLLLFNLFAIVVLVGFDEGPDDGDGNGSEEVSWAWWEPVDTVNITEDTVWDRQWLNLTEPVLVKAGATLTVRSCTVDVAMLDLLFWRHPAIEVEEGAALVTSDSEFRLFPDGRWAGAVVGPYAPSNGSIPYMARIVNLQNAIEPILRLTVRWFGEGSELGVGLVPAEGGDMELVHVIEPGEDPRERMDVEVNLTDHTGGTPWLVIFSREWPPDFVFIGNVGIVDEALTSHYDGHPMFSYPPYGDEFLTGGPSYDGWVIRGFDRIDRRFGSHIANHYGEDPELSPWKGLIESRGDVTLTDSDLWYSGDLPRKRGYDYRKYLLNGETYEETHWVGASGGHVGSQGGTLTMERCRLDRVPVTANGTEVSIVDCELESDTDCISLTRPSGVIEGTTLTFEQPRYPVYSNYDRRFTWAIAVQGESPKGPLDIRDCVISGFEEGVDLLNAHVSVADVTFQDIQEMALWSHDSKVGPWSAVSSSCAFEACRGDLFLDTGLLAVTFKHSGRDMDKGALDGSLADLDSGLGLATPGYVTEMDLQGVLRFMFVEERVNYYGKVDRREDPMTLTFKWRGWKHSELVPRSARHLVIDLADYEGDDPQMLEPWTPVSITEVHRNATGPQGTYDLEAWIDDLSRLIVAEPTMRLLVDGELRSEIDLEVEGTIVSGNRLLWPTTVHIEPGAHEVKAAVWGKRLLDEQNVSEEPEEIGAASVRVLRPVDGGTYDAWSPDPVDYVVLDEDVMATLRHEGSAEGLPHEHHLWLMGDTGAHVVVDGTGLPVDMDLTLSFEGNLTIELVGGSFQDLMFDQADFWTAAAREHTYPGGGLVLRNVTCQWLDLQTTGRAVLMENVSVLAKLRMEGGIAGEFVMRDSTIQGTHSNLAAWRTNLTMNRCRVASELGGGLRIDTGGQCSVDISDCTFVSAYLAVYLAAQYNYEPFSLNVTGCTYLGRGADLYVGAQLFRLTWYDDDPDWVPEIYGTLEGNVFGPGEDRHAYHYVVLHHGLFSQLWGDNDLNDSTGLYAMYITHMQVIPPDLPPFNPGLAWTHKPGILDEFPINVDRWASLDTELLYDVTENISREADPPQVPALLLARSSYYGIHVRGFATLDPRTDNDEATYPVYPDIEATLPPHVMGWPWKA